MMSRAAFLDLNGTLVTPIIVEKLEDLRIIPGAEQAVAALCRAGFRCPVVTVQSRIAKGLFSVSQFLEWFHAFAGTMSGYGAHLEGPYVCPHRFATPCACKKPKTLLYQRAAEECGFQLEGAFVIGDTAADMQAAKQFRGIGCLVRTGSVEGGADLARAEADANYVGRDVAHVVQWILDQPGV